ncbi:MAG: metal-dependent hydrolase [Candidatus Caldarchaeum sp.]|jgi:L-ascorbate metabolism protein UlaG (beta-lactamase superfamily)
MSEIIINFIGHASFSIKWRNEVIYIDPWLKTPLESGAGNSPVSPIGLEDVKDATVVLVSHGHIDHLGHAIEIVKKTGACLVCTPEVGMYADIYGIPYDSEPDEKAGRKYWMYPINVGGSCTINKVTYTAVPAFHSSSIMHYDYIKNKTRYPDAPVGYIIAPEDGPVIYFSGDTGVSMEMHMIQELYSPEICIMTAGGQYNMGVREFAYACKILKPKLAIPCHYDTFPRQRLDKEKLKQAVSVMSPSTKLVFLNPGESLRYATEHSWVVER